MSTELKVGSRVRISVSVASDATFEVDHRAARARGNGSVGIVSETSVGTGFGPRYRVGSIAWYAKEELTILESEPEIDPQSPPRIICTKCPALAEIRYFEVRGSSSAIVWATCHGQHRWFDFVPRGTMNDEDQIFNKLNPSGLMALSLGIENACKDDGNRARRMLAQIRFLEAAGQPITPEQFAPMRGDIERNLEFWQTLLVIIEGKIESKS